MRHMLQKYLFYFAFSWLLFWGKVSFAVMFEPGAGAGLEYTDNAELTRDDPVQDVIAAQYVGLRFSEDDGALRYEGNSAFNSQQYTQGTFPDQKYFNLAANMDWEMIKDRFYWNVSDNFYQQPIISIESQTPDNIEDSNVFAFGANMIFPVSARQMITVTPLFNQYYYEVLPTDNKQYSLSATWSRLVSRLTNVGLNVSARRINYTDNVLGSSPADTTLTNVGIVLNGQHLRSSYTAYLSTMNIKIDNGRESGGFSGNITWVMNLSSGSTFDAMIASELTDTSSAAAATPGGGVQVVADVIRTSSVNFSYVRERPTSRMYMTARYNKLQYYNALVSDRIVRDFNVITTRPVTQMLSNGIYLNYNTQKLIASGRLDERFTLGGNLKYSLSRKLHTLLDLRYRRKESTLGWENYNDISIFITLSYGFGDVARPTGLIAF